MSVARSFGPRFLACIIALGMAGCDDGANVEDPVRPSTLPSPTIGPVGNAAGISTVADAVGALEDTVQELYVESGITGRAGRQLVEQARLCQNAYEAGDAAQAFVYLSAAHDLIEWDRGREHVSTDEVAERLHRSIDLIGATVAANPP